MKPPLEFIEKVLNLSPYTIMMVCVAGFIIICLYFFLTEGIFEETENNDNIWKGDDND